MQCVIFYCLFKQKWEAKIWFQSNPNVAMTKKENDKNVQSSSELWLAKVTGADAKTKPLIKKRVTGKKQKIHLCERRPSIIFNHWKKNWAFDWDTRLEENKIHHRAVATENVAKTIESLSKRHDILNSSLWLGMATPHYFLCILHEWSSICMLEQGRSVLIISVVDKPKKNRRMQTCSLLWRAD